MNHCTSVCILMGTYNGESFLAEQLLSIENQSHKNWRLVISDDGSIDATLTIAREFQEKWGSDRLEIREGPKKGFCKNFLSLACDPSIKANFYAFSDQDDVWMVDKLSTALVHLDSETNTDLPKVYCGRTQIVDEHLKHLDRSPLFSLPPSFRNALVQSIAGGNTMVFNQGVKDLLESAGLLSVVSHDWWVYQLITGADGLIYFDSEPKVLYRQHNGCLVGSNSSIKSRIERICNACKGQFKNWNNLNCEALLIVQHLFINENREILQAFNKLRSASLKDRVRLLKIAGLYRQTWQGTLSLWLANLIDRI